MSLPPIGVRAEVQNEQGFLLALDRINSSITRTEKTLKTSSKAADPFNKALAQVQQQLDQTSKSMLSFIPGGDKIAGVLSAIGGPALAAAAGIAAVGAAFVALGVRGSTLIGLAESFDRLTASVGLTSTVMLGDLRRAAAGTIADFELMRQTNFALAGVAGTEFGKLFAESLPRLLEIARAQARATGQDVNYLFNSLVVGVKRTSPLLIDNTGIVLKVGKVTAEYAASLGKTTEELTTQERQIALLNATLEAGGSAVAAVAGANETAADKMARVNATITNIFDTLGVAVQPAFAAVLDVLNMILGGIENFVRQLAPIINAGAQLIGGLITFIADVFKRIFEFISSNAPFAAAAQGGFNTIKSYALGILDAANKYVFPAVIALAKGIADFLVGESPPPLGPLSQIDKGGAATMQAWLDGFIGVSLDPVAQVAAEVAASLGSVGTIGLNAVNKRLLQLDKAIAPFQNRLEIVKATFEAINEPAKAALEAIDRQIMEAESAFLQGDSAAAERIRQLDTERGLIESMVSSQQALVDRQQIQLALAQAQQAPERALLNIRKAQLEALAKAGVKPKPDGRPGVLPKPTGGAAPTPTEAGAAAGAFVAPSTSVLDEIIGGGATTEDALAFIQDAASDPIAQAFAENQQLLGEQLLRIGGADLGTTIGNKFKGLTDLFDPTVEGSPAQVITNFFNGTAEEPGSLASIIGGLTQIDVGATIALLGTTLADAFGDIFDPSVQGSPAQVVSHFLTGDGEGTLGGIISSAVQFFTDFPASVVTALIGFGASLYMAIAVPLIDVLNMVIGIVETGLRSVAGFFAGFIGGILEELDRANLGGLVPQSIRDTQANLAFAAENLEIARISTALPEFLNTAPGAALGGLFSPGMLSVGERGRETLFNASRVGVFPNSFVTAIEGLTQVIAQAQPVPAYGGGNSYNSSSVYNFNGVQGDGDARRRYNNLRAMMR